LGKWEHLINGVVKLYYISLVWMLKFIVLSVDWVFLFQIFYRKGKTEDIYNLEYIWSSERSFLKLRLLLAFFPLQGLSLSATSTVSIIKAVAKFMIWLCTCHFHPETKIMALHHVVDFASFPSLICLRQGRSPSNVLSTSQ